MSEEIEKDNTELRKYYATRKEVEELKDTINCLHESSKEYINKQVIRDKIEELEKDRDKFIEENKFGSFGVATDKIEGLKEILG